MLNILICDDDIGMIDTMRSIAESVLNEAGKRAKFYTYTDAASISEQIIAGCDIALLDIDYDGADYNGMDMTAAAGNTKSARASVRWR